MDLKIAKYIFLSICVLMVLCFIAGSIFNNDILFYIAIALAFIGYLFWLIFGRCPGCGKFLGRTSGKYCQHCGEELDW